ncbi:hypothetical protein B296_00050886 [Ensete ventricosum]|uniref:Uncharacterized protein n=1 Tax=Ensete ventricosum TaxID=4639 RepID=A0A426YBQ1_ENSVE|nr:hypothetical protein B296_00050886 [Ensete ventricosum]
MRRRRSRPSRTGNTNSVPSGDRFSSRGPSRTQAIVPESWFERDSCAAHPQERYVVGGRCGGERGASHVVLLFGSLSRKPFVDGMPGRKHSIDRGRSDVTCRPQSSSPRVSSPRIGSSTVNFGSLILDF